MISALQHKSKYKSNSILNFLEKKNQIFWFPCCSTREDLSIDISITNVGLILTKPGRFCFSAYGNSGYGQNSISLKFHISGFPWCSTPRSESKARVVKILTTQNSSQIISLAYLDDSADLNKSIKMVLTTHRPKQI